ncbi:hypothetical protein LJC56_08100 [Christensenellaceae bacterium OttesenSCG-928-K19]|nr:hypothetical protein [Christensenellaceae bacterium OttesenSCG-928-K19]
MAKKSKKTVATIVTVAVIIIVIVSLSGLGYSSEGKFRGALYAWFSGKLYETQGGGYIIKEENQYKFIDKMLEDGWVLHGTQNGIYTFERNGHIIEYMEKSFGLDLYIYELTG